MLILFAIALWAVPQAPAAEAGNVVVVGVYRNVDYGFRVRLPSGIRGVMAAAPAPNHGFVVAVSGGRSTVAVSAYYDTALSRTLRRVAGELLAPLSLSDRKVHVSRTTLGGLRGLRIRYVAGPNASSHREVILGLRAQKGSVGIVYALDMVASPADLRFSRRVLRALHRSFRVTPIAGA